MSGNQHYIAATQAEAEAAQAAIFQARVAAGCVDRVASSGAVADPQVTTHWAEPRQRATDGKWTVPVSDIGAALDLPVETAEPSWFPEAEE